MAYRLDNTPPPKPENFLPKFAVRNGATLRVALGCYYLTEGHDPHFHDYINWPAPNYHPGAVCQMTPIRNLPRRIRNLADFRAVEMERIHLLEEGYTNVTLKFDDSDFASHVANISCEIDPDDDYIIRMTLSARFDLFEDKPKESRFTLFACRPSDDRHDAVCRGVVSVLPGPPCNY